MGDNLVLEKLQQEQVTPLQHPPTQEQKLQDEPAHLLKGLVREQLTAMAIAADLLQ